MADTERFDDGKRAGGRADTLIRMMKRKRALLFLGITAPYLISYFQRSAPAVVGLEIAADLGLDPASLGVLVSMYACGYAAAQLPAGLLSDIWGARKTISAFVLIAALGSVIFALSPNFSLLSVGRFLVGMGVGFVYVPAVRIMTEWYREDELATYSGLLLGVGSLGAAFSATPLVLMAAAIGWRGSFLAVAAFTVFSAFFCWLTVRDRPGDLGLPGPRGLVSDKASSGSEVTLAQALGAVLSNKKFYLLGFLLFCYYGTILSIGSLWAGPYLQHVYGVSKTVAGNIVMMVPLGLFLGCPLSGYISDKVLRSRKKVLIGGAMLHLCTFLPLILFPGELPEPVLYVTFLAYGVTGGAFVINYACAKETVRPCYAGTALGCINIFLFMGGAFFQAAMGIIIGGYSAGPAGVYPVEAYTAAFLFAAIFLFASTILFAFFREEAVLE